MTEIIADLNNSENNKCGLCFEQIADIQLICGHTICEPCLKSWRRIQTKCPWCKAHPGSFIRILYDSVTVASIIPNEKCKICDLSLDNKCTVCVAYKDVNKPIPDFNKCNCVTINQCGCIYHRHCIGLYHLSRRKICPSCEI